MTRLLACLCPALLAIASCSNPAPPSQAARAIAPTVGDDQIEWQGVLACSDCDGIQTDLLLQHAHGDRRYVLTEIYLADSRRQLFTEHGHWERIAGLLQLRGDTASVRVYALLPDGSLQPRDSHGQRLPALADEALLPVAFATSQ